MSSTPPGQTPAGWYPDPNQPGTLRYWDGNAWTEHTNQQAQAVAHPGYQTYAPGMTSPPFNHLVPAILVTLFCCQPLGIPSIYKAAQVNLLWETGQPEAAHKAADSAKKFWWAALGVWVLIAIGYVALFVLVGFGTATTSSDF